jgi:hypothetical protein
MPQCLRGEDSRGVIETPYILTGTFLECYPAAALGNGQTAMVRAGARGRQVATAMGGTELQLRKPSERALKNKIGEGNRGFERIADDVR